MTSLYSLTVNPRAFELESSDGTRIGADTFAGVQRILRTHTRNSNGNSHLVMTRETDVPWKVNAWSISADSRELQLNSVDTKLSPNQRRAAMTLHITQFSATHEYGTTTFENFAGLIEDAKALALSSGHTGLYLISEFEPLDGITVPFSDDDMSQETEDSSELIEAQEPAKPTEATAEAEQELVSEKERSSTPQQLTDYMESSPKPDDAASPSAGSEQDSGEPELNEHKTERVALAYATRMSTKQQVTAPAHLGFRGWFNQVFNTKLAPSDKERTMRELYALIQRSLSEHRTIAMANVKGGAAKSTVLYLIAAILGRFRGGNILLWDNNENSGNIVERAIVPKGHDIKAAIDLYNDLKLFENAELSHLLKRYVLMQGDNRFYLLPSQDQAGTKQVIDGEAFNRMYEILRRFYDLMVVDTGNASNSGPWEASIAASDQLVIASSNADDGFRGSLKTIDALKDAGYGEKLANSVVVFTEIIEKKYSKQTTQDYVDQIKDQVREVIVVPFDPELAHGADIVYEALSPATQEAYIRSAAAILSGLN